MWSLGVMGWGPGPGLEFFRRRRRRRRRRHLQNCVFSWKPNPLDSDTYGSYGRKTTGKRLGIASEFFFIFMKSMIFIKKNNENREFSWFWHKEVTFFRKKKPLRGATRRLQACKSQKILKIWWDCRCMWILMAITSMNNEFWWDCRCKWILTAIPAANLYNFI